MGICAWYYKNARRWVIIYIYIYREMTKGRLRSCPGNIVPRRHCSPRTVLIVSQYRRNDIKSDRQTSVNKTKAARKPPRRLVILLIWLNFISECSETAGACETSGEGVECTERWNPWKRDGAELLNVIVRSAGGEPRVCRAKWQNNRSDRASVQPSPPSARRALISER